MNQTADLTEKTLSREEKYQGSFLSLHVDPSVIYNNNMKFPTLSRPVSYTHLRAHET